MNYLRPYQLEALKISKERYEAGVHRQLLALPTGTGKTVIFAHVKMHHKLGGRVLVVVHRRELVDQAYFAFRTWSNKAGIKVRIGLEIGNNSASSHDDVVIASVQSLGRVGTKRLARYKADDFGLLICDEAHHSVAGTYRNIFEHFGVLNGRNKALLLGVTATPVRSDGKGLAEVFDEIVYRMDIREAVLDGWLADIKGARAYSQANLDRVRVMPSGDFDQLELSRAINLQVRNELVLKTWKSRAHNRQTIVFCADIRHAKDMAATFQAAGIKAAAVWGEDPNRKEKLEKHKAGQLQVLTNCEVLTEGYDDWSIGCIVMARPTQSELLFVQMVGRGTRIPKGIENLNIARAEGRAIAKEECLIIDVVDSTSKHSLITLPTLFGLSKSHDYEGRSAIRNSPTNYNLSEGHAPHPGVAARVRPVISEVDLLKIPSRDPLPAKLNLQWVRNSAGDRILHLPDGGSFTITRTSAGYEVCASLMSGKYGKLSLTGRWGKFKSGPFSTLEEAFDDVEDSLRTFCKRLLSKLVR